MARKRAFSQQVKTELHNALYARIRPTLLNSIAMRYDEREFVSRLVAPDLASRIFWVWDEFKATSFGRNFGITVNTTITFDEVAEYGEPYVSMAEDARTHKADKGNGKFDVQFVMNTSLPIPKSLEMGSNAPDAALKHDIVTTFFNAERVSRLFSIATSMMEKAVGLGMSCQEAAYNMPFLRHLSEDELFTQNTLPSGCKLFSQNERKFLRDADVMFTTALMMKDVTVESNEVHNQRARRTQFGLTTPYSMPLHVDGAFIARVGGFI